jgi:hypothetical protein
MDPCDSRILWTLVYDMGSIGHEPASCCKAFGPPVAYIEETSTPTRKELSMFRVAPLAVLFVVFLSAGAVQAQYYTTYYAPTTTYYAPATTDYCCGNVQTATVTTAYYAPTTTYYAPTTTYYTPTTTYYTPTTAYYAPTTTYYAPATTTYYAAAPTVVYYPAVPRYRTFFRWW